jgi:hypothetical protein
MKNGGFYRYSIFGNKKTVKTIKNIKKHLFSIPLIIQNLHFV